MNIFRAFAYIAVALDGGSYDADSTNMLDAIHTSIVTFTRPYNSHSNIHPFHS